MDVWNTITYWRQATRDDAAYWVGSPADSRYDSLWYFCVYLYVLAVELMKNSPEGQQQWHGDDRRVVEGQKPQYYRRIYLTASQILTLTKNCVTLHYNA